MLHPYNGIQSHQLENNKMGISSVTEREKIHWQGYHFIDRLEWGKQITEQSDLSPLFMWGFIVYIHKNVKSHKQSILLEEKFWVNERMSLLSFLYEA